MSTASQRTTGFLILANELLRHHALAAEPARVFKEDVAIAIVIPTESAMARRDQIRG